jgi:hypothetical protein
MDVVRRVGWATIIVIVLKLVTACGSEPYRDELPPHTALRDGTIVPSPGYAYVNNLKDDFTVVWVPGKANPDVPNVVASPDEGYWRSRPGYTWDVPNTYGPVHWQPGLAYPGFPHVVSSTKEGEFVPEAGYTWDTPNTFGNVHRITNPACNKSIVIMGDDGKYIDFDLGQLIKDMGGLFETYNAVKSDITNVKTQLEKTYIDDASRHNLRAELSNLQSIYKEVGACLR